MKLLCKLPHWLGGGHRWRKLTKKESDPNARVTPYGYLGLTPPSLRRCRRCSAERIVKARKTKTKETTNE